MSRSSGLKSGNEMSRIRTVKPDFFRHEALQDLEVANPGLYPMLVYEGLWTQADRQGVFPWNPRQLHLDILPFIPFDFQKTLEILQGAGEIELFENAGKKYGFIPTFAEHQRFSGDEASGKPKYPAPLDCNGTKQARSKSEASQKHERNRERSRE